MHPLYSVHPPPSSEVSAFHTAQMQTKNYVHASIPSQPENLPCITLFRNSKFRNFCDPLNPQGSDYDYAHETPAQVPHLTQSHPSATAPHRHLRNQRRAEPKPNPSPKTRATDPQKAGTLTPMGRDGEGRERACVVTSSTRMAAASSAPVMLTKVSIASCGGRAMVGGAPAPAAAWGGRGDATARRLGSGAESRRGEESRSSGAVRVNSSVGRCGAPLSYCSPPPLSRAVGRQRWACARTTDAGNVTCALRECRAG